MLIALGLSTALFGLSVAAFLSVGMGVLLFLAGAGLVGWRVTTVTGTGNQSFS